MLRHFLRPDIGLFAYLTFTLLAFLFACAAPAFAAESVIAATTVDLTPLALILLGFALTAVGVGLRFLFRAGVDYFERKLDVTVDADTRAYLDKALDNAISYGSSTLTRAVENKSIELDVKNEVVARAAQYALDRVPDALDYFSINEEALKAMLTARLEKRLDGMTAG